MPISSEVRRLGAKWQTGTGWPKRLEWIEINGIRGWTGQRFELKFPIMAVVGENGVGKSTVLQAAAAVYESTAKSKFRFASDFFPDTTWEKIEDAEVASSIREGTDRYSISVRKPTDRWRGNPERRKRGVQYIDLSRIQPISARVGYTRLANPLIKELSSTPFEKSRLARLCEIMGRSYQLAKMALTDADDTRYVPVMAYQDASYSGFHQGAGETTIAELLKADLTQYGLILIDEVETSLHPKVQRRLIRDLAEKCRELELQIILTTHSPYVLDELPLDARAYIMQAQDGQRKIIYGISPEFAMSKMDDVPQYECDLYVEDVRAQTLLTEIIAAHKPDLVQRCQIIPAGASSVVQALGQMVMTNRFPRPTRVYLDGDQGFAPGRVNLPGEDAPERVVFEEIKAKGWLNLAARTGRGHAALADECSRAMLAADEHEWVNLAASKLVLGGDILWQAMCAEWVKECLAPDEAEKITRPIEQVRQRCQPNSQLPERLPLPASRGRFSSYRLLPGRGQNARPSLRALYSCAAVRLRKRELSARRFPGRNIHNLG
jgi:predicted ATPase